MKKLLFVIAMSLCTPALAQENLPPECRILKQHKPSADATYQPGVDVHGKPVVPADINAAPPMGLDGQTMVVPLSIDLAQRLQNLNIAGLDMKGTLGFLEVGPGSRVRYNGQDLTQQVQVLCDQNAATLPPAADGQTPPDAVEYAPVKEKVKDTPAPKPVTPHYPEVETPKLAPPLPRAEPEQGEIIEGGEYR